MSSTPFKIETAKKQLPGQADWFVMMLVAALHVGAGIALFHFSWTNFIGFVAFYLMGVLGITVGYHRLLTHKSFQAHKGVERFFAFLGVTALQNGPVDWIAEHRLHHAVSDTELDPHNIHKGFWHAHMGWMFQKRPAWFKEGMHKTYAPDIMKDPFLAWIDTYSFHIIVALGALMLFFGGWTFFLWAFCVKQIVLWHVTWFVNSASHLWGYRHFEHEQATNNWWVGLLAMGEGWHNTHHAFPTSARHGLRWWEIDVSWMIISTLQSIGLVRKVKLPPDSALPWKNKIAKSESNVNEHASLAKQSVASC
ncbi:MAG: fatty acid desaturase [Bdellovibrionota bacterium]